jgi:GTP-binding protein YchF
MKIGIVGFPSSGKTTLFNALTGQNAPTGFGSSRVNLGSIKIPDRRVDRLAELANPRKLTYAEATFADVPGGRGKENLDPQTIGRIREMDALVQVLRGFDDGTGMVNPLAELTSFEAELVLSDMQIIEKRLEKLRKDHSNPGFTKLLERCLEHLNAEKPLRDHDFSAEDLKALSGFALLTLKPLMFVLSRPEAEAASPMPPQLVDAAHARSLELISLCGAVEAEIATLSPEDQLEFLGALGLEEPASARFLRAAFAMLDLISFLTHGPDECRAWPIRRGSTAVVAASAIHSDIARGFIRAEVVKFEDMDRLESESACKEVGKFRVEGRDYVVQDGDICHFRFNV